jgi:predicted MFS family arabinose efflux permease
VNAAALLAHQGGWDEILFVAAPLVVLAALLALANRRADAALHEEDPEEPAG